jgi:hypothetical protein
MKRPNLAIRNLGRSEILLFTFLFLIFNRSYVPLSLNALSPPLYRCIFVLDSDYANLKDDIKTEQKDELEK